MPSSADRTVGCMSLCMCIMRLQRHIGVVALIGPMSVTAGVDCELVVLVVVDVVTANDVDVLAAIHYRFVCLFVGM